MLTRPEELAACQYLHFGPNPQVEDELVWFGLQVVFYQDIS